MFTASFILAFTVLLSLGIATPVDLETSESVGGDNSNNTTEMGLVQSSNQSVSSSSSATRTLSSSPSNTSLSSPNDPFLTTIPSTTSALSSPTSPFSTNVSSMTSVNVTDVSSSSSTEFLSPTTITSATNSTAILRSSSTAMPIQTMSPNSTSSLMNSTTSVRSSSTVIPIQTLSSTGASNASSTVISATAGFSSMMTSSKKSSSSGLAAQFTTTSTHKASRSSAPTFTTSVAKGKNLKIKGDNNDTEHTSPTVDETQSHVSSTKTATTSVTLTEVVSTIASSGALTHEPPLSVNTNTNEPDVNNIFTTTPVTSKSDNLSPSLIPSPPPSSPNPNPQQTRLIVGLIVGLILVLSIVLGFVFYYVRRKRSRGSELRYNKRWPLDSSTWDPATPRWDGHSEKQQQQEMNGFKQHESSGYVGRPPFDLSSCSALNSLEMAQGLHTVISLPKSVQDGAKNQKPLPPVSTPANGDDEDVFYGIAL